MAVAVLIDATVVRGVLLPAGLALLGDRAWAMPGRGRQKGQQGSPPSAWPRPGVPGVNVPVRAGSDN